MLDPIDTPHTNMRLGKPINWDDEKDGLCVTLPVCKVPGSDLNPPMFHSWYSFSAEEVARIVAGCPIRLTIVGHSHPPVSLNITEGADW